MKHDHDPSCYDRHFFFSLSIQEFESAFKCFPKKNNPVLINDDIQNPLTCIQPIFDHSQSKIMVMNSSSEIGPSRDVTLKKGLTILSCRGWEHRDVLNDDDGLFVGATSFPHGRRYGRNPAAHWHLFAAQRTLGSLLFPLYQMSMSTKNRFTFFFLLSLVSFLSPLTSLFFSSHRCSLHIAFNIRGL